MRQLIIDTGPIVAALDKNDPFHAWADSQLEADHLLITSDSVITESFHLLRRVPPGTSFLLKMLEENVLQPVHHISLDVNAVTGYLKQFEPRADFADACLMHLSEIHPDTPILTIDSDFRIYRRQDGSTPPILLPPGR